MGNKKSILRTTPTPNNPKKNQGPIKAPFILEEEA
jgi:hypothetical protein